ncbi:MAG: mechanosensitive ion channel family protein [Campylobacterota bacterium]|nr:mechanosensitive ion channel family protein [Campylobacterota bacterium]
MKILLLIFIIYFNALAFDYEKNIHFQRFTIPELNKISDIQLELKKLEKDTTNKSNKELIELLKKERSSLAQEFISQIVNRRFSDFSKQKILARENQIAKLKILENEIDKSKKLNIDTYIQEVTYDIQVTTHQHDIAFRELIVNGIIALNDYRDNELLEKVYLKFEDSLAINTRVYDNLYAEITSNNIGTKKSAEELEYLTSFYELEDQFAVYSVIFLSMKEYSDKIVSTENLVNLLRFGKLINIINELPYLQNANKFFKKNFFQTVGEVVVINILLLSIFILYFLILAILRKLISTLHNKDDDNYDSKIKVDNHFIYKSLAKPLKILLFLFAIDISQRIIFYAYNNLDVIYYIDIAYALIFVWILFRLIDNYVLTYSGNFLVEFPGMRAEVINFSITLLRVIIMAVAITVILDNMNISVTGFLASLGIGGIALALAAKTSLENMFSSISIIMDNMFSQGDWIVTAKGQGTVVEIGLRSTKVRTFDNALTYFPNSYLANTEVKNFSKRKLGRRIKLYLGVTYSSDMDNIVKGVDDIRQMLESHPDIADDNTDIDNSLLESRTRVEKLEDLYGISKTLLVYIDSYANSSINIMVYCFSKSVNWDEWLAVKQDVLYKIAKIFEQNSLEFAFPSKSLYLSNDDDSSFNLNIAKEDSKCV